LEICGDLITSHIVAVSGRRLVCNLGQVDVLLIDDGVLLWVLMVIKVGVVVLLV
jgi:hypothetical protein